MASKYWLQAKDIREKTLGNEHPLFLTTCNNLTALYILSDSLDIAENLLNYVIKIRKKNIGSKSREMANAINNLAQVYEKRKNFEEARRLYIQALQIYESLTGKVNVDYMKCKTNLVALMLNNNQIDSAYFYQKEVSSFFKEHFENVFVLFSEKEREQFWNASNHFLYAGIEICLKMLKNKPEVASDMFNEVLFLKSHLFSSYQKTIQGILMNGDSTLLQKYTKWKSMKNDYLKGTQITEEKRKELKIDLSEMSEKINTIEKEMFNKVTPFAQEVKARSYSYQTLIPMLKKNEVLIDIYRLDLQEESKKDNFIYFASVCTSKNPQYPEIVIFENSAMLARQAFSYYKSAIEHKITDTLSYKSYWQPIADRLEKMGFGKNAKKIKKVFFSPDGIFHQININTLYNAESRKYLFDEQKIQIISSTRDFIETRGDEEKLVKMTKNFKVFIFAYPAYRSDFQSDTIKKGIDRQFSFAGVSQFLNSGNNISILEGTKKEAEEIKKLLTNKNIDAHVFLKDAANEENVKKVSAPTILHIATHGFFIQKVSEKSIKNIRDAELRNLLNNPFFRSGLLLANCQNPPDAGDDGILTASEAVNMNLLNTELVVLSACETGLGDVQSGEGIFGLQRAFRQAGCKSVLNSLWKVSDEATQMLMVNFYAELLKGNSKREAFVLAQKKLRKHYPHPFYWGAFVLIGN